ncbi:SDR family NAD(P)-dependent oxidoreductase [Ramlibacter terrae]|uniref:SDR family NAD(P)-dependent oxidoreductase n=1 Tax=Ramlibacter terrae TaxID=2732511 RepID=A0ABX6P4Z0_9BURK|nr:SDR family NAD(P)-dependent oxidoreductase [Ramlibacter terrae]
MRDRIVLVTGASGGIGAAVVERRRPKARSCSRSTAMPRGWPRCVPAPAPRLLSAT